MNIKTLNLAALGALQNGVFDADFTERLEAAYADCADRPHVKTARTVTLTLNVIPNPDDAGELYDVDLKVQSKLTLPKRSAKTIRVKRQRGGGLFVNELDENDLPGQTTMPFPRPITEAVDTATGEIRHA